jgi:hypothetical protein
MPAWQAQGNPTWHLSTLPYLQKYLPLLHAEPSLRIQFNSPSQMRGVVDSAT